MKDSGIVSRNVLFAPFLPFLRFLLEGIELMLLFFPSPPFSNRCAGEMFFHTHFTKYIYLLLESSVICVAIQIKFQYFIKFICYFITYNFKNSYQLFFRWRLNISASLTTFIPWCVNLCNLFSFPLVIRKIRNYPTLILNVCIWALTGGLFTYFLNRLFLFLPLI